VAKNRLIEAIVNHGRQPFVFIFVITLQSYFGKVLRGSYECPSDDPTVDSHPAIMLVTAYIVERRFVKANVQAQETVIQVNKGHGRIEKRRVTISPNLSRIPFTPHRLWKLGPLPATLQLIL
jgi:hypothetical protein